MPRPLLVNAVELLRRPGSERILDVSTTTDELGIVDDERFAAGTPVDVRLHLESLTDGIVVDGAVTAPWQGRCRRCLAETSGTSISEVHELYQLVLTDPDAFELTGDQLDLQAMVREVVALDAPATPLCRDGCEGLCPTCGADLNTEDCRCAAPELDHRWAALDELRRQAASTE